VVSVINFILVYSILGIELILYWNGVMDVYGVDTTGQPFIIGVCGLVKILFTPLFEASLSRPPKTYCFTRY
jgi:hypothetical protein